MDEIYSKQFGESTSNETEVSLNEIDQVEDSKEDNLQDDELSDSAAVDEQPDHAESKDPSDSLVDDKEEVVDTTSGIVLDEG